MTSYLTLSEFINNIEKIHNDAGITSPEDIFAAMSGNDAIMYKVDAKQPENMALMIDAILDTDEVLNRKLKWLYLEMHQTQANFLRDMHPELSQVYLDLASRFAESTDQTHIHGPIFVDDDGPNIRWHGLGIYMSLSSTSIQEVVAEPSEASIIMNIPVESAVEYLTSGDIATAQRSLPQGVDFESSLQPWTMSR